MEKINNDIKLSPAFVKAALIRQKKRDYGGISQYFPYGDMSFAQMIHVKSQRLLNLADMERMGEQPINESIEDSLLDIMNYASYWFEWKKGVLDE